MREYQITGGETKTGLDPLENCYSEQDKVTGNRTLGGKGYSRSALGSKLEYRSQALLSDPDLGGLRRGLRLSKSLPHHDAAVGNPHTHHPTVILVPFLLMASVQKVLPI